jgi:hypothetical protein
MSNEENNYENSAKAVMLSIIILAVATIGLLIGQI